MRLETAPELPAGWNGKQHACAVLSERVGEGFDTLVFVDADVRLQAGALPRLAGSLKDLDAALVSGVPRQTTGTWLEVLIVPQILLILLGYLPLGRMRADRRPSLGAGCGQLFVAERDAYGGPADTGRSAAAGTTGSTCRVRFAPAGFATDLVDVTDLATCRMYDNAGDTWRGFLKNAAGGMGSARGIVPWTVLLLGGHVMPWVLLAVGGWTWPTGLACGLTVLTSVAIAGRFKQGVRAVATRPLAWRLWWRCSGWRWFCGWWGGRQAGAGGRRAEPAGEIA